jgi:FkbM family methyltransferase
MIKDLIRNQVKKFGYDFVKTAEFNHGKKYKRNSNIPDLDYYETPRGNYYLPKGLTDDYVANHIKRGEIFDKQIIEAGQAYIQKNTCVLDIGANFGQMSIELSKTFGDDITLYSFEAQKKVFDILEKNIAANNCKNIKAYYNAVYDEHGKTMFFPEPDLVRFSSYGSYGLTPNASKGKEVKSITIDSIDFEKPVSFMKVDIQGSDLFALRGAVKTIEKYQMPIIFEYEEQFQDEFNTSFQQYVDFVDSIGYKFLRTIQEINFLIVPKQARS